MHYNYFFYLLAYLFSRYVPYYNTSFLKGSKQSIICAGGDRFLERKFLILLNSPVDRNVDVLGLSINWADGKY